MEKSKDLAVSYVAKEHRKETKIKNKAAKKRKKWKEIDRGYKK
jgi:hypothetical protein